MDELLGEQIVEMANRTGLTSSQWQQDALLINPPSLNHSALLLLAELHVCVAHVLRAHGLLSNMFAAAPRAEFDSAQV